MVFVVDDDEAVRHSLAGLFRSIHMDVETFESVRHFMNFKRPDAPACLVLDVRMPGGSGLDFQGELEDSGIHIPIVFITGYGDVPMTVRAMKAGAVEFLTKPFREQDLLDAVQVAIERNRDQRRKDESLSRIQARYDSLTAREREVFGLVTTGLMNKQIAAQIGVSEITVKVHRGNVMRKMGAKAFADLVRMADALGPQRGKSQD